MRMKYAIGIDIGGTNTKFGISNEQGEIFAQGKIKTQEYSEIKPYIDTVYKELESIIPSNIDHADILGIGIGAPNANFHDGTLVNPPNLPWKNIVPLAEIVKERFELPAIITNDANAAALGEMTYGNAKHLKDFVVLTVGTGLGSGIVINGEIVYGYHGFAGELGHTLVNANGRFCGCGKRGCLETYVSATGIRRTVYKLMADYNEPSLLRSISFDDLSTKTITEAAKRGDHIAIEAFKYTGRVLGMKLSDFVVHTDPQAIFLLGGLAKAGKHLFEPARENLEKFLMPMFRGRKVRLLPSGLKDDDAPILGASSLVWKYINAK
ncbi:ROK family protein [Fulvivirga sp. RKSG066]|nr:ROK family protein [Fulvivirga aurantia]